MCKILITAWVMFLVLGAMAQPAGFQPQQVSLGWELLRNYTDKQPGFTCRLTVTNNGKITLPARGWKIYFNLRYHGYTLSSGNPKLELKHISGELFAITPLPANKPLLPGKSLQMEYSGNGRIENFQDLPSGFFWVNEQDSSRGIDMGKLTVLSASALPAPDQQIRYGKNLALQNTSVDDLSPILPTPQQCTLHDF
ncbi:MAG TPA: carbohydate-binding domain-containing protein, partial [Puia sp.]|nr:carbohydate-binding domain-containing protein [Puia sp.]